MTLIISTINNQGSGGGGGGGNVRRGQVSRAPAPRHVPHQGRPATAAAYRPARTVPEGVPEQGSFIRAETLLVVFRPNKLRNPKTSITKVSARDENSDITLV